MTKIHHSDLHDYYNEAYNFLQYKDHANNLYEKLKSTLISLYPKSKIIKTKDGKGILFYQCGSRRHGRRGYISFSELILNPEVYLSANYWKEANE